MAATDIDLPDDSEPVDGYQSYEIFVEELECAYKAGAISRFDADLLARMHRTGLTIKEITSDPTLTQHFGSRGKLKRYLEDLYERLQAYAKE